MKAIVYIKYVNNIHTTLPSFCPSFIHSYHTSFPHVHICKHSHMHINIHIHTYTYVSGLNNPWGLFRYVYIDMDSCPRKIYLCMHVGTWMDIQVVRTFMSWLGDLSLNLTTVDLSVWWLFNFIILRRWSSLPAPLEHTWKPYYRWTSIASKIV